MPRLQTANTNIPAISIAEKISAGFAVMAGENQNACECVIESMEADGR